MGLKCFLMYFLEKKKSKPQGHYSPNVEKWEPFALVAPKRKKRNIPAVCVCRKKNNCFLFFNSPCECCSKWSVNVRSESNLCSLMSFRIWSCIYQTMYISWKSSGMRLCAGVESDLCFSFTVPLSQMCFQKAASCVIDETEAFICIFIQN